MKDRAWAADGFLKSGLESAAHSGFGAGLKYSHIEVVLYEGNQKWLCQCSCGKYFVRHKCHIIRAISNNSEADCGCRRADRCRKNFKTHGLKRHPLHRIWCHMKERCYSKNCLAYPNYGGRGIYVTDEWRRNAEAFISWGLKNGYATGLQLDRKDNDGPYAPWNCRFVDRIAQANNKRGLVIVEINGERISLAQAVQRYGKVKYGTAYYRIMKGWSAIRAITEEVAPNG